MITGLPLAVLRTRNLFAQGLGRPNPDAHAAKNEWCAQQPWLYPLKSGEKKGDVDSGGAGRHARRVMADIAVILRNHSLVPVKRCVQIRKVLSQLTLVEPVGNDPWRAGAIGHSGPSDRFCNF